MPNSQQLVECCSIVSKYWEETSCGQLEAPLLSYQIVFYLLGSALLIKLFYYDNLYVSGVQYPGLLLPNTYRSGIDNMDYKDQESVDVTGWDRQKKIFLYKGHDGVERRALRLGILLKVGHVFIFLLSCLSVLIYDTSTPISLL